MDFSARPNPFQIEDRFSDNSWISSIITVCTIYIYICICKFAYMHALSGDATDTQVLGDDISSLETLPVSGLEIGFNSCWFFRVALLILKHRIYGPTVNNVVFSTFISSYDVWRSFQGLYAIHTYVRGIGFLLHPHCLMFTPIWGYSFRCNNLHLCLDTWNTRK